MCNKTYHKQVPSKGDKSDLSTARSQRIKSGKKKKRKIEMDRSIGKQSGESEKSVLEKKKEATVGRICGEENNVLSLE